jgi:hypothetical protein
MTVYTISNWSGRFGNNIQQICNGILYSEINKHSFISPDHQYINSIYFNCGADVNANASNDFYYYSGQYKSFDINIEYLIDNIRRVCLDYIKPNLKFNVEKPFDENTLVIHIRSGDIFSQVHLTPHDYCPNPLYYYLLLIDSFEKIIVVTESDNYNPIIDELKKIDKVKIQSSTVEEDFSTLMRAKNLASSGTGTFSVAAALCSTNIENFYCSNLYMKSHLNPEMLMKHITVKQIDLDNFLELNTWKNSEDQRNFLITYSGE